MAFCHLPCIYTTSVDSIERYSTTPKAIDRTFLSAVSIPLYRES